MKKLFLLLILLLSVASFAQTSPKYYSTTCMVDPGQFPYSYGLVCQVWNASSASVFVDSIEAQSQPLGSGSGNDPLAAFSIGFGMSNIEESACTTAKATTDYVNDISQPVGIRITGQPCRPNGLVYGLQPNGSFNYTPTNTGAYKWCYSYECSLEPKNPIEVTPNHGITIYVEAIKNGNWVGWYGGHTVTFQYHQ